MQLRWGLGQQATCRAAAITASREPKRGRQAQELRLSPVAALRLPRRPAAGPGLGTNSQSSGAVIWAAGRCTATLVSG